MPRTRSAFTLIELLIVVGIIAILAAIAIPNMLEAQIRAKVARVKSDLRTVTTGLESYRVDHNGYPLYHYARNAQSSASGYSFHPGGTILSVNQSPPFDGRNPLTTPVAYLTSAPGDPFNVRSPDDAPEAAQYWYVNWDYLNKTVPGVDQFEELQRIQGPWRLHSSGPDRGGPDSNSEEHTSYDPTNGTVSLGDVIRTQRQGQI